MPPDSRSAAQCGRLFESSEATMSRPRRSVDYGQVRRLHASGLGTRSIARKLGVSRSLIYRVLCGDRPESGPPPESGRGRAGGPRGVWSVPQRQNAQALLQLARGSATDEEFAAATRDLDRRLDRRADSAPFALASEVCDTLRQRVRAREEAVRRATKEVERLQQTALDDFDERWEADARSISREIARLDFARRSDAEGALEEERERSRSLVERRVKTWDRALPTEDLVDRLVREGIERAARSISGSK